MWLMQRCQGAAVRHGVARCQQEVSALISGNARRGFTAESAAICWNCNVRGSLLHSGSSRREGALSSVFDARNARHFSSKKRGGGSGEKDSDPGSNGGEDGKPEDVDQPPRVVGTIFNGPPNIVFQVIRGQNAAKQRIGRNASGGKIRRLPIPIKTEEAASSGGEAAATEAHPADGTGHEEHPKAEGSHTSVPVEETTDGDAVDKQLITVVESVPGDHDGAAAVIDPQTAEEEVTVVANSGDKESEKIEAPEYDGNAPVQFRLPILHFHSTSRLHALPALAMFQKPAFPGFYQVLQIQDQAVLQCLSNIKQNTGNDYVGGFLTKTQHTRDFQNVAMPMLRDDAGAVQSYEEMHVHGTLLQVITITPHLSHQGGQVILMPHRRIKMTGIHAEPSESYPLFRVSIEYVEDDLKNFEDSRVTKALHLEIIATVKELIKTSNFYKEHFDHIIRIYNLDNPSRIADLIAGISMAKRDQLQAILAEVNIDKRLAMVLEVAKNDLEFAKVQAEVKTQIEEKMSREQRKYILTEQMKMIRKELGLESDDKNTLIEAFETEYAKVEKFMSKEASESYKSGISRLKQLETSSAEFGVCRSHLEWLLGMPWGKFTKDSRDIRNARQVLDKHHFGLKDVKTRLMEYMATSILKGTANGKIICLAGPPGVGKTSIATSVAELLGRKLYRFSLGGLFDVAELRGHRRTYVGALPGKFVQALKYTGSMNPLIVLDEIDKLGRDARGDPASALLEVLDPSQNENFRDYYLDIPVDLSHVLFICTANAVDTIPGPLIDRMEIINIPGYLPEEKLQIAKNYLIPQTLKSTGLQPDVIEMPDSTIQAVIQHYSREAGVRSLLRCIEKIYRKVALNIVMDNADKLEPAAVNSGEEPPIVLSDRDDAKDSGAIAVTNADEGASTAASSERGDQSAEAGAVDATMCSVLSGVDKLVIEEDKLQSYLGVPIYTRDALHPYPLPYGVVMGLAWTNAGGATMYVEARGQMVDKRGNIVEPNRKPASEIAAETATAEEPSEESSFGSFHGTLKVTGHLGNVMTESSQIALTFCKTFIRKHQPRNLFLDEAHIHIHVPEGATPKDGPSGGITMASALISAAAKKRIRPHLAMTGELTLSGKVLRVGGIKEKLIAAIREGVTTVVLPKTNEPDVLDLEESVTSKLEVIYVDCYDDVYAAVFEHE
ncbi:ATP-dependent protease La family protein, putative [Babesia bigemina]|uniref:endopeptidase La n=1 Tax=Babesia bigemina TaxID=5866 RepID=A0A061DCV2_BABBI|nr:ATP-dependent protease La family protein, putative [Babesia bigemina]CDR96904.1 ATP-dependent protease La family protein, putative [Babesia bigemina]|eukprot:XP_012769090.1 ATP-dependent protease La family protein, putative [Babesia bigemina]